MSKCSYLCFKCSNAYFWSLNPSKLFGLTHLVCVVLTPEYMGCKCCDVMAGGLSETSVTCLMLAIASNWVIATLICALSLAEAAPTFKVLLMITFS